MSQKIFQLRLPVESTSLYILCCSLADNQKTISLKNIQKIWNSGDQALTEGLGDLEEKNILRKIISDRKGNCIYQLVDSKNWKA